MNASYQNILRIRGVVCDEIFLRFYEKNTIDFQNKNSSLFYTDLITQLYNWIGNSSYYYHPIINELEIPNEWFLKRFNDIKSLNLMLLNLSNNKEYINNFITSNNDRIIIFNNLNLIADLIQQLSTQLITCYYNVILDDKIKKVKINIIIHS
ncbi:hypothetical protein RB653_010634 [Dictyostelium firmibasis]|uniref:Uncharacterized protein n=1 Tax=Dictyostelium firmibasis TaxID=79012 RepID=A0AAN7YW66_9MYCE